MQIYDIEEREITLIPIPMTMDRKEKPKEKEITLIPIPYQTSTTDDMPIWVPALALMVLFSFIIVKMFLQVI